MALWGKSNIIDAVRLGFMGEKLRAKTPAAAGVDDGLSILSIASKTRVRPVSQGLPSS